MTLRHNHIRNTTANLLTEVCKDVHVEPQLQPLSGEKFSEKTSNNSDQDRVDISARGFWLTVQVAFFDVRVFNPSAKRYVNQELCKSYEANEKEKKKQYNERILQIEHGTVTPLAMFTTGGMGRESRKFCARFSEMISEKRKEFYGKLWQILFLYVYVVVDLFTALQTQTQRICCLHLQRLAKLHQMLVHLYYPFEFHILHKLYAATAFECTIVMRKYDKIEL